MLSGGNYDNNHLCYYIRPFLRQGETTNILLRDKPKPTSLNDHRNLPHTLHQFGVDCFCMVTHHITRQHIIEEGVLFLPRKHNDSQYVLPKNSDSTCSGTPPQRVHK